MPLLLTIFTIVSALELLIWSPWLWRWRRGLAILVVICLALISLLILIRQLALWSILLAGLSLYRGMNLGRLIKARSNPDYLHSTGLESALWLIGGQVMCLLITYLAATHSWGGLGIYYLTAGAQLTCSLTLAWVTNHNLSSIKPPQKIRPLPGSQLPSLTVAIPARNETEDLQACLDSLLTSDYPKLEILVLDDCSQNRQTPEIIRSYAHDGVRFIAGQEPPKHWLAKNYAYYQLAQEANGELVLFCGVDTRYQASSLSKLVEVLIQEQLDMCSILPRNHLDSNSMYQPALVQPSRYAWELALPRGLIKRPFVLSSCWLIKRSLLEKLGGFGAVSRKAIPEAYFAAQASQLKHSYRFIKSNQLIGISSHKTFDEQQETAIRTRYLQLHRRLEMVSLIAFSEFFLMIWPLLAGIMAALSGLVVLAVLVATVYTIQVSIYFRIASLTYRQRFIRGLWLFPVAVIYDIWLVNYSMWRYEFAEVIWKGRNVCIPLMRVEPRLPST